MLKLHSMPTAASVTGLCSLILLQLLVVVDGDKKKKLKVLCNISI